MDLYASPNILLTDVILVVLFIMQRNNWLVQYDAECPTTGRLPG